jgi:hypothetical protein
LPRQARDKHIQGKLNREEPRVSIQNAFAPALISADGNALHNTFGLSMVNDHPNAHLEGEFKLTKPLFLKPFIYKCDLFTKTGSGQT